jgi:hypothetical protein
MDTTQNQLSVIQSTVEYNVSGTGVLTKDKGVLEWGADGRIRLYKAGSVAGEAMQVVFDMAPQEITSVANNAPIGLSFTTNQGQFNINFPSSATTWRLAGGLVGMIMSNRSYQNSGQPKWVQQLTQAGVTVNSGMANPSTKVGYIIGIAIAIIVVVLVIGGML